MDLPCVHNPVLVLGVWVEQEYWGFSIHRLEKEAVPETKNLLNGVGMDPLPDRVSRGWVIFTHPHYIPLDILGEYLVEMNQSILVESGREY